MIQTQKAHNEIDKPKEHLVLVKSNRSVAIDGLLKQIENVSGERMLSIPMLITVTIAQQQRSTTHSKVSIFLNQSQALQFYQCKDGKENCLLILPFTQIDSIEE